MELHAKKKQLGEMRCNRATTDEQLDARRREVADLEGKFSEAERRLGELQPGESGLEEEEEESLE